MLAGAAEAIGQKWEAATEAAISGRSVLSGIMRFALETANDEAEEGSWTVVTKSNSMRKWNGALG